MDGGNVQTAEEIAKEASDWLKVERCVIISWETTHASIRENLKRGKVRFSGISFRAKIAVLHMN